MTVLFHPRQVHREGAAGTGRALDGERAAVAAGDVLDVRIAIAVNDAATATAVTPTIAGIDLLCDIKG